MESLVDEIEILQKKSGDEHDVESDIKPKDTAKVNSVRPLELTRSEDRVKLPKQTRSEDRGSERTRSKVRLPKLFRP